MNDTLQIASVTGVDVAFRVAGPGARSYAFVIDWHFRLLLALAWLVLAALLLGGGMAWVDAARAAPSLFVYAVALPAGAIYFLYHPVLEVVMRGRTPGKRIAGVRIVLEDGRLPGAGPLLIRNALRLVDSLPVAYVVGLTATLLTRHSVRLGDLAAGTVLVYDTPPADRSAAALAADQGAMAQHGVDRIELARDLLARWDELLPEVRARLCRRLLAELDAAVPASLPEPRLRRELERRVDGG